MEEKEQDIYSKEGREKLVEDGEITPEEDGFMQGESNEGQDAKCRNCGTALLDEKKIVEKVIKEEKCLFCCDKCAEEYSEKKE